MFKVSATNDGYEPSQKMKPKYIPDFILFTFRQEVEKFVECDNGTFVIKREDVRFRQPITLMKNIDVLCYQLQNIVSNYLNHCGVDKQDTCIVEYELLRENKFSTNEYISDNFRDEVKIIVKVIKSIGDDILITPNEQIKAMLFDIPLNYVSSEIFFIRNVRTTSGSPNESRKYLKGFIAAFFRMIPKDVIEKYDTLYEKREKVRIKNAGRDKESGEIRCSISPDERKAYGGKTFALVSRLIKHLTFEINNIIHSGCGHRFGFESFANWKKTIIDMLKIDESLTKYEDSKTQNSILNEISAKPHTEKVAYFLRIIDKHYHIRDIHREAKGSAIFYKFLTICPSKFLNDKYKRKVGTVAKEFKRSEFKNLCLQYFGLEPNQMRPNKCEEAITKLNSDEDNREVWYIIKPPKKPK